MKQFKLKKAEEYLHFIFDNVKEYYHNDYPDNIFYKNEKCILFDYNKQNKVLHYNYQLSVSLGEYFEQQYYDEIKFIKEQISNKYALNIKTVSVTALSTYSKVENDLILKEEIPMDKYKYQKAEEIMISTFDNLKQYTHVEYKNSIFYKSESGLYYRYDKDECRLAYDFELVYQKIGCYFETYKEEREFVENTVSKHLNIKIKNCNRLTYVNKDVLESQLEPYTKSNLELAEEFILSTFVDLKEYTHNKYQNCTFFKVNDDVLYQYNNKSNDIFYSYDSIHLKILSLYDEQYSIIRELIKKHIEENLKIKINSAYTMTNCLSSEEKKELISVNSTDNANNGKITNTIALSETSTDNSPEEIKLTTQEEEISKILEKYYFKLNTTNRKIEDSKTLESELIFSKYGSYLHITFLNNYTYFGVKLKLYNVIMQFEGDNFMKIKDIITKTLD